MEVKNATESNDSKRKVNLDAVEESSDSANLFKKAKHGWQIKGLSTNKEDVGIQRCGTIVNHNSTRTDQDQPLKRKYHGEDCSSALDPIVNGSVCHSEFKYVKNTDSHLQEHLHSSEERLTCSLSAHQEMCESRIQKESNACKETLSSIGGVGEDRTCHRTQNSFSHTCKGQPTDIDDTCSTQTEFQVGEQSNESDANLYHTDVSFGEHSRVSSQTDLSSSDSISSTQTDQFENFLAKRQNSHIAKAVVDNAINKTLEDMGVSPDSTNDEFVAGQVHVENAGISQAIQSQGLVRQNPTTSINPFMSHVAQLSDIVFSSRLTPGHLQQTSRDPHVGHQGAGFAVIPDSSSVSSSDLLDQAVTMAISSQGLALQRDVL